MKACGCCVAAVSYDMRLPDAERCFLSLGRGHALLRYENANTICTVKIIFYKANSAMNTMEKRTSITQ